MNAIILEGTQIGNNVIVGSGAVVSGFVPDNCLVASNPAKVIMSLDEYYQKRKSKYVEEAKVYAAYFIDKYHRKPKEAEMNRKDD